MHSHHVIPETEYYAWTERWRQVELTKGWYEFFLNEHNEVQAGVRFSFDSLRYLFSTPGVTNVKIRFGLKHSDNHGLRFHLLLFGADKDGQILTPYFTSAAFTYHQHYPAKEVAEGNLPAVLMEEWKKEWHHKVKEGSINQQMFKIHYGFLQGYTYPLKEIMAAVGTFKGASTIHIKFGLHKYYALYETPDSALEYVHTFGLMLYAEAPAAASLTQEGTPLAGEEEEDSGYYDFTAPCPHTC